MTNPNIDKLNDHIKQQIKDIDIQLEQFIDDTSDILADFYDPTRIQQRVIDETRKKLQEKQDNWNSTDFGLSSLKNLSPISRSLLKSSSVDVSASPSDSLSQCQNETVETQAEPMNEITEKVTETPLSPTVIDPLPVTKTRRTKPATESVIEQMKRKSA